MAPDAHTQEQEWASLHAKLKIALAHFGHEDPFGGGDYWLVDDNWGENQQKVCVTNIAFLTSALALAAQELLRDFAPSWEILLSLDNLSQRPTPMDVGVLVRKNEIIEHWNAQRMKDAFGQSFRWQPRSTAN